MWVPFELEMLKEYKYLVINCRSKDDERFVAQLLDDAGIRYPRGDKATSHHYWKSDLFYYIIRNGSVRYGSNINEGEFGETFLLTYFDDIERNEISDAGFESIICAGGVMQGGNVDG